MFGRDEVSKAISNLPLQDEKLLKGIRKDLKKNSITAQNIKQGALAIQKKLTTPSKTC